MAASGSSNLVQALWIRRMLAAEAPLRERLVLLWHEHLPCALAKVQEPPLLLAQLELFRARAFGPFDELCADVGQDPAMLRYLDGDGSRAGAPNENFARELLELFTVGAGSFGEEDVREAARAWTGWRVEDGRARFVPAAHDGGPKVVLGVAGRFDGPAVARLAAGHPATARRLADRLARSFVADDPGSEAVDAIAEAWTRHQGRLDPILRELFRSGIFYAPEHRRALTRSPLLVALAALRATGLRRPDAWVAGRVREMGQPLLDPPTVQGYARGRAWREPLARCRRRAFLAGLGLAAGDSPLAALSPSDLVHEVLGPDVDDSWIRILPRGPAASGRRIALVLCHPGFERA